jgi:predicted 3-demethylubiquinone-9 3-methyltransferase (glyoxalase superfamily)/uncharacterized protein YndB with AHSA1/START domain
MSTSVAPFRISRTFAAPLARVWRAWTDMEQFSDWFGPKGVTCTAVKRDFRPGGLFHYKMVSANGSESWGRALYREIVPQEKLVWVNSFSNPAGEVARPPFPQEWPREMLTTVTFVAKAEQTEVTVEWIPLNATDEEQKTFDGARDGMKGGWSGTFEQLEAFLAQTPMLSTGQKITPFLWFDGQAEAAARFYASIFPDSEVTGVSPMIVNFRLAGLEFMGLNGGPMFKFTEAVSFFVSCETQAEVDYYWDKLSEGGTIQQCGWLKDKFGLSWQIVPTALGELMGSPDPERSQRVMQAMMQMVKLDIAGLKAAAEGK